jgi:3-oxoadipate enol-lactonase
VIQREFAQSRDGLKIRYELRGAGDPVAMIMGFSGSLRGWGEEFLRPMEQRFRLVLIDNRGTGESDKPDRPWTVADMAADVASVLDHAGIARPHVFGISMGGMIAQEFALANPGRTRGLALGCTTCGGPHGIQAPLESVSALVPQPGMSPEEQARRALSVCLGRVSKSDGRAEQFIARALAEFGNYPLTPPHTYARQMGAIMGFDTYDRLPQIAAPTLVIHGDDDNILPVGNAKVLGERIKGSRTQILAGAGHLFIWEEPETVTRAAAELFSRAN